MPLGQWFIKGILMQRNWIERRLSQLVLVVIMAVFMSASAMADVFSGTVVSVSATSGRLVVKARSSETNRSFKVSKNARITVDGKKNYLSRVKVGQSVSVFYSGASATRLIVRAAKVPAQKTKVVTKPPAKNDSPSFTKPETPKVTETKSFTKPERNPSRPSTNSSPSRNTSRDASGDWNQFRGPNRDNKSTETGLLKSWSSSGPRLVWTARGLGEAYSSVSIADSKVVTTGNINGEEHVIAVDLQTGNRLWATRIGNGRRDNTGNGPRGTPSIVDGKVYALGANGQLACLDVENGRESWSKNVLQEYGGNNITWGISESPLVDGNKVIVTPGGNRGTMVALDKESGRQIWASRVPSSPKAAYSSVLPITVGGVRQYVTYTHAGVIGVRASDGNPMWGQRESANGTANCSSPIFFDNQIFTASGYGTGGALFRLQSRNNQTTSRVVYTTKDMVNHHGGMVEKDGFLYGSNEGVFACIDLRTGEPAWRSREVSKGSITYADGLLYCRSQDGPVVLVEANSKSYVEKGRFNQPQRSNRQSWAHPVVADGKLFLRDQDILLAFDLKGN
jgi:outer membrane protein assembly factor BamB